jgi:L-threonylcarbamoyladenylate synthase
MQIFKEKVLEIVRKIPLGKFMTYKQISQLAGKEKAFRVVGNILRNNTDSRGKFSNIPCHRVIKNDYTVGGYLGKKNLDWLKAALLLKEGAIGVIPTDTIYGICTSALNKSSVEKVYKLRKRNPKKPCIILISSIDDLSLFEVKLQKWQRKILEKIWPGKISVILSCKSKKFSYLHRGTKTLAFRFPKDKFILKILKISGPLIAPSANWESYEPARTINQAKKYFNNKVFYLNRQRLEGEPSTLLDLTQRKIKIIRKGSDYDRLKSLLKVKALSIA